MRFLPHDAADELLVTPPCLAGGGDPRWVTVPLHQAGGWRYDHTPLSPIVHLVRPDQQAELSLHPDPDEPWWTILHAPTDEHPAWYARFGAHIPVEILAAFTDALTEPAPEAAAASDPFEILYAAGWLEHSDVSASSPDSPVHVERAGQGQGSWFVTTSLPGDPDTVIWRAHLGADTPLHLVAAFTSALTDPAPLRRDPLALPFQARPHLQTAPAPTGPPGGLDPLEQRVQDLAARRRRGVPSLPPRRPQPPPRRTR